MLILTYDVFFGGNILNEKSAVTGHDQLKALLGYWLHHNEEHAEEFREWAEKISAEREDVAGLLRSAVARMTEANTFLEKAKQLLES